MLRDQTFSRLTFLVIGVEVLTVPKGLNYSLIAALRRATEGKFFHYRIALMAHEEDYPSEDLFKEIAAKICAFVLIQETFYVRKGSKEILASFGDFSSVYSPHNFTRPVFAPVLSTFWTQNVEQFLDEVSACAESPKLFQNR